MRCVCVALVEMNIGLACGCRCGILLWNFLMCRTLVRSRLVEGGGDGLFPFFPLSEKNQYTSNVESGSTRTEIKEWVGSRERE
ncbi:hypothetical protein Hanom_Chr12g01084221 [Helianthus anomalus]